MPSPVPIRSRTALVSRLRIWNGSSLDSRGTHKRRTCGPNWSMAELFPEFNDVVCGLLIRSGRILFVHRNESRRLGAGPLGSPGGHIEQGESDIDASPASFSKNSESWLATLASLPRLTGATFDARVFVVDSWSGEPENRAPEEHDRLAWFDEGQLPGLVLADPDLLDIVVEALHQPRGAEM